VKLIDDFLPADEADALLATLLVEVPWQQEQLVIFGRATRVPRLLAWCGDAGLNYRYSRVDHVCSGWLPSLHRVRCRLADEVGFGCNLVLLNRYRNGDDCMGWHADDEPGLGRQVASVSLGATRRFLLRPLGSKCSRRLNLGGGSLLLMDGRWRHALPRTRQDVGERVNLTFRQLDA
jgi:alkylated DNA repair dioxygenase AlkB